MFQNTGLFNIAHSGSLSGKAASLVRETEIVCGQCSLPASANMTIL
jgi:hypothetical protein